VVLVLSGLDAAQKAELTRSEVPFAVLDPAGDPGEDVPAVGAANWHGGLAATRHLLELGHRRIGAIAGPSRMMCSRARIDGYRAALETAGVVFDPSLIAEGNFHHDAGRTAGLELLGRPDRPTAVFAGNDLQALGVYEAARELGLRIPEDLSVVGFDDLPFAQWVTPRLTTVRTPLPEMAAVATRMVLQLLGGERPETTRVEVAGELVVRDSTAPPPPRHQAEGA
jgi:LacI family xylobiose transport system transcriptional regulator